MHVPPPVNCSEEEAHRLFNLDFEPFRIEVLPERSALVTRSGFCFDGLRLLPESYPHYPHLKLKYRELHMPLGSSAVPSATLRTRCTRWAIASGRRAITTS